MAFLTMRCFWQLVAPDGNGFGLFLRFLRSLDLRSFATGSNHGAPWRLHRRLSTLATSMRTAGPSAAGADNG